MNAFDLDHVGVAVHDLDRASAAYRRLGFTLTERSWHVSQGPSGPLRTGTGNHCLILARGYVELIAATEPGYAGRLLADLARYEGLHLVALGIDDGDRAVAALKAAGAAATLRRVTRPFTEQGRAFEAVFDIVDLPEGTFDEGHVFAIAHGTPEAIWQPHLTRHANGATDLREIVVVVDDPLGHAARFARLFGASVSAGHVALRAGTVTYLDPRGFSARFPGAVPPAVPCVAAMIIGVANLARAAAVVEAGLRDDGRLIIPASAACGTLIEFVE